MARAVQEERHQQIFGIFKISKLMKASFIKLLTLAATIGLTSALAQDTTTPTPGSGAGPGSGTGTGAGRPEWAGQGRLAGADNLPTEVQALVNRFQEQRQEWIANRQQLLDCMQDMTDEERAAAIAELRELQREQVRQQRDLARQIRAEMRALRNARRNGGG